MSLLLCSILLSVYFSSLIAFSFVSHPVTYCLLLLSSAVGIGGYSYMLIGFSWYLILFCLVYIGGVYILFIFVSVHNPNPLPSVGGGALFYIFLFSFFFLSLLVVYRFSFGFVEYSHYLCSGYEGLSYCFFCLFLLIGFVAISVVCSEKDSFFR